MVENAQPRREDVDWHSNEWRSDSLTLEAEA
jgi:hypothetical protein